METKIRMHINSEDIKIHLPKINFNTAIRFMKFGLWSSSFAKDQETKEYIRSNKKNLIQFLEAAPMEMNNQESLTLVDNLNILHLLVH